MHFIVVDDRRRLLSGACTSPDVAGLVGLLEDTPAFVCSLPDRDEKPLRTAVARGRRVIAEALEVTAEISPAKR